MAILPNKPITPHRNFKIDVNLNASNSAKEYTAEIKIVGRVNGNVDAIQSFMEGFCITESGEIIMKDLSIPLREDEPPVEFMLNVSKGMLRQININYLRG